MPSNRSGFGCDSFHQVAVAAQCIDIIIKQFVLVGVVTSRQPSLGHRHTDRVGDTLAERPGRRFDARRFFKLGVPHADATDLTKLFDVVHRHRKLVDRVAQRIDCLDADQMQRAVEQHRRVATGQDKAIATRPMRLSRIILHRVIEQLVGHGG